MTLGSQLHTYNLSNVLQNTYPIIREPTGVITWTGPGFVKVTEGDILEFYINNIPYSMSYDILIRFEPQMPDTWQEVRVTVTRDRPVDQNGNCANEMQIQDLKVAYLPRGEFDDLGASFQGYSGYFRLKN